MAEREGVRRSFRALQGSDVAVMVVDPADPPSGEDVVEVRRLLASGQRLVWVINKIDARTERWEPGDMGPSERLFSLSARTGEGLRAFEEALASVVASGDVKAQGVTVTSQRQYLALQSSLESLEKAATALESGYSNEFAAMDLREPRLEQGYLSQELEVVQLCRALRDNHDTRAARVIAVSASMTAALARDALAAGAHHALAKPLDPSFLLNEIGIAAESRR